MATWCQRDNSTMPFTPEEEKKLDFLYSEWTHPHFISINVSMLPRYSAKSSPLVPFARGACLVECILPQRVPQFRVNCMKCAYPGP